MPWRPLWTCVSTEVRSSHRAIITLGKHMGVGAQEASFSDTCLLRSTMGTWGQSDQLSWILVTDRPEMCPLGVTLRQSLRPTLTLSLLL